MTFTRKIEFLPAYDKRNKDQNKNYGVHGVDMRWYLAGQDGVVQFVVSTNWYLPHVQEEFDSKPLNNRLPYLFHKPLPADVGYHSRKPMYDGQYRTDSCELLDGEPCYYDGSGIHAQKVFDILVMNGGEAVWKYLENYYNETFLGDTK